MSLDFAIALCFKWFLFFLSDYDVDWYGGGSTITNPFTLINKQLVKEEEVIY